ncbi:hypothetical protein CVT24_003679 [Panaeolus cyanescens]|uniref:N-acetyltransferase domain-containing protein n=1 Tax=Panaeolus cyanescens TaxID=181874 RepID=A0A409VUP5_9AGAR|nr:hypothetical protein CVT24_003679 [Panaeolus cyanescens]
MHSVCLREAQPQDFAQIAEIGIAAMIEDPLLAYFECRASPINPKENPEHTRALSSYIQFTLYSSWYAGGVIKVACAPSAHCIEPSTRTSLNQESVEERILAAAIWMPPRKRVSNFDPFTLLRSGGVSLAQNVGMAGLSRRWIEYPPIVEHSWKQAQWALEDGKNWSPLDTWSLTMAFTEPAYQGRGLMTTLIRDWISSVPGEGFTLQASTTRARDFFYRHFGFELLDRCKVGVGHASAKGLPETKGPGVELFTMLKRNVERKC